ncbi:MAG: hypothetical protein RR590_02780 [Hungatella sp.]
MTATIAYVIAAISIAAFVTLWFRIVYQELRTKGNMVNSAKMQLTACHKYYMQAETDQEKQDAKFVLLRSEDIYRQSIVLYNQMLKKPQNRIPGFLMGFLQIKEMGKDDLYL